MSEEAKKSKIQTITDETLIPITLVIGIATIALYVGSYAARMDRVEAAQKVYSEEMKVLTVMQVDIAVMKKMMEQKEKQ